MMKTYSEEISINTKPYSLIEISDELRSLVRESEIEAGLCTVFIKHTSASLTIQENADPSARHDLENWLRRLVPEDDPHFTHTHEGPDDMPSHIKSALTSTSIGIPIVGIELTLGTWQGVYVWEHRARSHRRKVQVLIQGS